MKKLSLLLLFITLGIFAQESKLATKDSLIGIIETTNGKEKLAAILAFCEANNHSLALQTQNFGSKGLVLAEELKDDNAKAYLLRCQGVSACILGEMENSLHLLRQSIDLSESINDSLNLGKCYRDLGRYYFTLGDFKESRVQDSLSLIIAGRVKDMKLMYDAKHNRATSYLGQGMYSKALELLEEALVFCNMKGLDCSGTIVNKAIVIHNIGKPSEALDYFFKARKAFFKKGNFSSVALVDHHIGYLLERTELYEEAFYYFEDVKEFYEKSGDVNRLSAIYSNMGELMLKLDKPDEAEKALQKALRYKNEAGIKTIGDPLAELGLVALKRKNYEVAFSYFQDARKAYKAIQDKAYEDEIYNYFSMSYFGMKDYENAERYALLSVAKNKKSGIKRELALSYENLVKAYEVQHKFDLALQTKKELEAVYVDLKGSNELLAITKKIVIQTLEKNEGDKVRDTEIIAEASTSSSTMWVLLVLGVLFFGGSMYYLKFQNKSAIKNNGKIEYLQKEEASELLKALKGIIETEKPYLKQELTLSGLAELLDTSGKKLSTLLNHSLSTSFYDYINHYRIEAVKEKLAMEEYEKYSLVGVAYSCGFNSKSSFYRAFKKETGISPTVYKAQKTS